jgi:hypothetical protein
MSEQVSRSEPQISHTEDVLRHDPIDCSLVHEFAEAFAVNAIEEDLRESIDRHCNNCPLCASLVRDLQQTAMMLAYVAPQVQPPATAKAALFSRVAQAAAPAADAGFFDASLDYLRTPTLPASSVGLVTPAEVAVVPPVSGGGSRSWWSVYAAPLATLPLLLALGIVGFWGISTRVQLNDQKDQVDVLNARVEFLNSKVGSLSNSLEEFDNFLSFRSAKESAMVPEVDHGNSDLHGTLLADPRSKQAMIQAFGLDPKLESYWVVAQFQDGTMEPVTELSVDGNGEATSVVEFDVQVSDLKSVHIRPTTADPGTDVEILAMKPGSLYTTIGPDIFENSDTDTRQSQ